jgi:hypothetical protein
MAVEKLGGRMITLKSLLIISGALAIGIWAESVAASGASQITPAEMIQTKLPRDKTLVTATRSEALSAICAAIRKWPNEAPQIVRTAAGARKEMTTDILRQSIECLRGDAKEGPASCDLIGQTVAAAISADGEDASKITELALQEAPDCAGGIEAAMTPGEGPNAGADPPNLNPPPGSLSGIVANVNQRNTITVCDNGINVQLSPSNEESYLTAHPSSRSGACQATAAVNK